jgi:hypothetical protein
MTSLHTWAAFTGALNYGPLSDECLHLPEFNIELANAYASDINRKVWIQEFGVVPSWVKPSDFETFVRTTMLSAARSDNLWGFTWWCSHEIQKDRGFTEFHHDEYEFGLLTTDNKIKPLGEIVKACIADMKKGVLAEKLPSETAIVVEDSADFNAWVYGEAFCKMLRRGEHAKFILPEYTLNAEYKQKRGIKKVLTVGELHQ